MATAPNTISPMLPPSGVYIPYKKKKKNENNFNF